MEEDRLEGAAGRGEEGGEKLLGQERALCKLPLLAAWETKNRLPPACWAYVLETAKAFKEIRDL